MVTKDVGYGLANVLRLSRDAENAVGLVVDQRQTGLAGDSQYTVAHPVHDVPEEGVRRGGGPACRAGAFGEGRAGVGTHPVRSGGSPSGRTKTRLGHHRGLHETDLNPLNKGQRLCPVPKLEFSHQVADSMEVRVTKLNRPITKL
jgi:hypothetical protein